MRVMSSTIISQGSIATKTILIAFSRLRKEKKENDFRCPAKPSFRPSFHPSILTSSFRYLVQTTVTLSVRPSVRPSVRLSVCPSVRPFVHLSVRLSVLTPVRRPSISTPICQSVRPSVITPIRPSVRPSVRRAEGPRRKIISFDFMRVASGRYKQVLRSSFNASRKQCDAALRCAQLYRVASRLAVLGDELSATAP